MNRLFVSVICLACSMSLSVVFAGSACFTARVVDEKGAPLKGVTVVGAFYQTTPQWGVTDTNGEFIVKSSGVIAPDAGFSANLKGYYESGASYMFKHSASYGDWTPWNPVVSVILRRIENPIPMFAKNVRAVVPVLDQFVGYDLKEGDWVSPHGKGEVSDVQFKMRKRFVNVGNFDASIDLAFTNAMDGLDEISLSSISNSEYRLPRTAPIDGYVQTFTVSESSTNYFQPNEDQSYLFRVRSVTNAEGKIVSALYGKIRGYIGFDVRRHPTGVVNFTYYLNPTPNDRNMEFDPKRNLLQNLKSTEEVRAP